MESVGDPDKSSFSGVERIGAQLRCFSRGRGGMKRKLDKRSSDRHT